jgi:putative aminopeptidase FrvX
MGDSEIGEVLSLVDSERIVELSKELIRIPSVTGEERAVVQHARTSMAPARGP